MPPTMHAAAALPPDLLARICAFLPPGDAILTAPRVSKALAAAAAPRVTGLRAGLAAAWEARRLDSDWHWEEVRLPAGIGLFSIPMWALQEAWPQLGERQRERAAARLPRRLGNAAVGAAAAASGTLWSQRL
jgi:hypothetical protein